jgi:hypothetical protein
MAVQFTDLNSEQGLKQLDDYLLTRSYITGYVPLHWLSCDAPLPPPSLSLSVSVCSFEQLVRDDYVSVSIAGTRPPGMTCLFLLL